jgi:hypothetical protein
MQKGNLMAKLSVRWVCLAVTCALSIAAPAQPVGDPAEAAMQSIRPEAIRATMSFLADDQLEGRGTATRGYEIAAKYMASEFASFGLSPAGDASTYFQGVPFRAVHVEAAGAAFTVIRKGKAEALVFGTDFLPGGDPSRKESSVEGPVVYVGFGVTAPELNYDDYKGVDAKGKIVALVYEAPNFASSLKAHYSTFEAKVANAVAHGAVGMIILNDPVMESIYPFSERKRDLERPGMRWLEKDGTPHDSFPQLKGGAGLSLEATKKFLVGSGHTAEEVLQAAKEGKPLSFPLPVTVKIHERQKLEDVSSPNVVTKLEGSDPALKNEYVVFSAHLDHLGIGAPR